jgi:Uma2 family endonuclease
MLCWRFIFFARKTASVRISIMKVESLERPLTYEEERGKPMPSRNHAAAQTNLLGEFLKNPNVSVYSEFTLEFEGRNFTPDISLYPRQSVDWRHDQIRGTESPLAVVEIASPAQDNQSVMDKVEVYFRNGVKSCWYLQPYLKTITILGPDGKEHVFHSGVARDPYTGVTADVAAVFP